MIIVEKFDTNWKNSAEFFDSYFVCEKCYLPARCAKNVKVHSVKCNGKKIIKCGFCDQEFPNLIGRKKHVIDEHRNGSVWQCNKCSYNTHIKGIFRENYKTHLKKFSCETCRRNFSRNNQVRHHQMQHRHGAYEGNQVRFKCIECSKSFATKISLTQHKRSHRPVNFQCDICAKIFRSKQVISHHMQNHFKIACPVCQQMTTKLGMIHHLNGKHSPTANYTCNFCDKTFRSIQLYKHRYVHKVEEVKCDFCAKTLKSKVFLKLHMRCYLKNPCEICRKLIGIRTIDESSLKKISFTQLVKL